MCMISRLTKQDNIKNGKISASKKNFEGSFETHWHEFYEIEFIISGKGTYYIDGKEYDVKPGMIFFMTPVNFHTLNVTNAVLYNIMFSEDMCDIKQLSKVTEDDFPVAIMLEGENFNFFEILSKELINNTDDTEYAYITLNNLVAKLVKIASRNKNTDLSPISIAELYILNKFRDKISLGEVSKHVGFSPAYFSAYFKQNTGITFKEYVNKLRFDYACNLLEFSDLTVMQVCLESGFEEYTNFIRRFKQRYGTSPGQYKKNLNNK